MLPDMMIDTESTEWRTREKRPFMYIYRNLKYCRMTLQISGDGIYHSNIVLKQIVYTWKSKIKMLIYKIS